MEDSCRLLSALACATLGVVRAQFVVTLHCLPTVSVPSCPS